MKPEPPPALALPLRVPVGDWESIIVDRNGVKVCGTAELTELVRRANAHDGLVAGNKHLRNKLRIIAEYCEASTEKTGLAASVALIAKSTLAAAKEAK